MNRSLVLVAVTAALALAACTSTPTPDNNATSTPTGTSTSTPQATVVTEVVTQTVTNPPVKPVIDSFGYGGLKLGMTLQQALDTKLIGPARPGGQPSDVCTTHDILGTGQWVSVSKRIGVANIYFSADMTADGVGVGGTEAALKAKYTNLTQRHMSTNWTTRTPENPSAWFDFTSKDGKLIQALLRHVDQDCHS
ncbi:hypothetical protein G7043_22595 [Lentzea sp. NEAU-D13]|uniref:Lipoprotein n=1 Tax=Lentzea alba TaxID=2714351 RepID=A0A7C9VXS1_9PSEU|nr:hypothetical protein [Lentzea alba]NGY61721.1 hypothetical protein [Lentzea alba]